MSNPVIYNTIVLPIDGTAASPKIQIGGSSQASPGTGIYGDESSIKFSVGGTQIASITSAGIVPAVAVAKNKVLAGPTTGADAAPTYRLLVAADLPSQVLVLTSGAGAGGGATEAMTVTGLLTTDTILSVSQKTPGLNNLPLIGFSTQATNALTAIFSADPGAGAVIIVAIKR